MPIYAYKCSSCGHTDDALQKVSADPLTECPACHQSTYARLLTAPGFQLKGSGWYATDFKGGNASAAAAATAKSDEAAKPAATPAGCNGCACAAAPAAAAP